VQYEKWYIYLDQFDWIVRLFLNAVPAGKTEIDDMPERQAVISPQSAGLNSVPLMAECQ
jgi:hypothetical protein